MKPVLLGMRVRLTLPNLWAGRVGVVKSVGTAKQVHYGQRLPCLVHIVRLDGFDAAAASTEMEEVK